MRQKHEELSFRFFKEEQRSRPPPRPGGEEEEEEVVEVDDNEYDADDVVVVSRIQWINPAGLTVPKPLQTLSKLRSEVSEVSEVTVQSSCWTFTRWGKQTVRRSHRRRPHQTVGGAS